MSEITSSKPVTASGLMPAIANLAPTPAFLLRQTV